MVLILKAVFWSVVFSAVLMAAIYGAFRVMMYFLLPKDR